MQLHYYIGEGPEAEEIIAEIMDKQATVHAARAALCKECGVDNLFGCRGNVEGVFFKEKQNLPHLKGEMCLEGGYGYYPKLNCKAGKELAAKLRDPALAFDINDHIIKRLKISRMVAGRHAASRTGMALYSSVAGIAKGKILVIIPGAPDNPDGGDPMPSVPEWMREVKESEWLAAQGK